MDAKAIIEEFFDFLGPKLDVYEQPDLNEDDLRACLVYAAESLGGKA